MAMAWIGPTISGVFGLAGGLLGGGDEEEATRTNEPWAPLQPYLLDMYKSAASLPMQQAYPYRTYAERSPMTDAAQRAQVGYATNYLPGLFESGNQALAFMLGSPDVATNPYVQRMIQAQNREIGDTLSRDWLPQIRSGAVGSGQYGGSRQGIAEGLAMSEATKRAQNAAAQIGLGAYGQGLDQQRAGMALFPQQAQLGLMPSQIYGQVGGAQEGYQKSIIDDAYNRWMFNQQAPYTKLAAQSAAFQGASPYGTSTMTGGGSSPWATGIGTAASIYGLGQQAGWWGGQAPAPVSGPTGPVTMGTNSGPYSSYVLGQGSW
jgi:hypothetical protein